MNKSQQPYKVTRYLALASDPIHVGTGGYRLGRVDLSIVREPGTNVPKIPGTSLAGACRAYAAMAHNRYRWQNGDKTFICAGAGKDDDKAGASGHCCQPDCPICVTFGFSKGAKSSFQGLAQFSDARLVFFPVHSLAGPVWVTCPQALVDCGVTEGEPADGEVRVSGEINVSGRINLGWLMLGIAQTSFLLNGELSAIPTEIRQRAVLVSNKMFSHIVNDNLEVRTSVSINPVTGAAAEGALFTFEALPRGSVLAFEVVVSDPRFYRIDGKTPLLAEPYNNLKSGEQQTNEKQPDGKQKVKETAESGLRLFEALGVGGMSTRGMGRLKVLGIEEDVE